MTEEDAYRFLSQRDSDMSTEFTILEPKFLSQHGTCTLYVTYVISLLETISLLTHWAMEHVDPEGPARADIAECILWVSGVPQLWLRIPWASALAHPHAAMAVRVFYSEGCKVTSESDLGRGGQVRDKHKGTAFLMGTVLSLNVDQPPRENSKRLKTPPEKYIWSLTGSSTPGLKITVGESVSFSHFYSTCMPRTGLDVSRDKEAYWIFRPWKKVQVNIENLVQACNYTK